MISIEHLTVEFSARPLFTDINYVINRRDRIALTGKNGAGKSTMLKIIAGLQTPTSGAVNKPKDITIGYLPQVMKPADTTTLKEEAEKAFVTATNIEVEIDTLTRELGERTDWESQGYQNLIDRLSDLNEQLALTNTGSQEAEVEKTLLGLGFERKDFSRPTSEFSGGWRMRIELAKLLLQRPDVLLLDEPTNHLDIESIRWLEKFLAGNPVTVVLISHDRAFMDNVTTRTIEITCGTIHDYNVSYSKYVVLHQERIAQQRRAWENQQKLIHDTEAFIERFRYQATKAIQVQSRIKQLEKIVPIEIDEVDNSRLRLSFPPAPRSGDYPVICHDVAKSYGSHLIFDHVELTIQRGEKVAFVGKNGEGKSTLVKCIMGEIPFNGELKVGHGVKIGYFAQNQAQLLDEHLSVFDTIDRVAVGDIRTKIRDILGAFMFGGEAIDKPVGVLSGGERARLAMIKLLLEPVNLLILDEPTNHLDLASKDVLKEAIRKFDGTVIVVSHDRDFLDGLVEKVYEFGHQRVREYIGGIYDFLRKKDLDSLQELEKKTPSPSPGCPPVSPSSPSPGCPAVHPPVSPSSPKPGLSFEEQKARKSLLSKLRKRVDAIEAEIARCEATLKELEIRLSTPEGSMDVALFEQHGALRKKVEQLNDEWLEASEALENAK